MSKKLILVVPIPAVGHVNACIGLCKVLLSKYRVVFLLDETFRNKASAHGFEEFIFESEYKSPKPGDDLADMLIETNILGETDPLQSFHKIINLFRNSKENRDKLIATEIFCKKAFEIFNPDLIITDHGVLLPSIYYSGKPWIFNISAVPNCYIYDYDHVPPGLTGLPTDSDRKQWKYYKDLLRDSTRNDIIMDEFVKLGYQRYPNDKILPETQILTVYAVPEELNHPFIAQKKDWFNIEVYNKASNVKFEIKDLVPKEFYDDTLDEKFSGKWIYLSMGSMGSADLKLMKRLIQILSKTNHKYIVSKGPKHNEYQLPRNMWGERYLPQVELLPSVDLVITHGGNNSITEIFSQGKPMIILPLFADQFDNAQRLDETGYGKRLDSYKFKDDDLIKAIDDLLSNKELYLKLKKASERIQRTDRHGQFLELVNQIFDNMNDHS